MMMIGWLNFLFIINLLIFVFDKCLVFGICLFWNEFGLWILVIMILFLFNSEKVLLIEICLYDIIFFKLKRWFKVVLILRFLDFYLILI